MAVHPVRSRDRPGVGAIVHCAGDLCGEVERQLVAAPRGVGAPHLVHMSIVGPDRVPLDFYRSRLAAERVIENSGLPWTILRTTQFHVPDLGGPEVRHTSDLARAYLRSIGRRRPVLPVRLPGKVFRGYRPGGHLTPDRAVGAITFEEYLAEYPAPASLSYRGGVSG
ncbi:MAG: hypothetical protein ACT4NY_28760 [Pseudonocardiales bacterium]